MSVTQAVCRARCLCRALVAATAVCGILDSLVRAAEPAASFPATFDSVEQAIGKGSPWNARKPVSRGGQLPLARLVRNPDNGDGTGPAYALADQAGSIQRYVEAVPTIDLEPYVGYAVKVRHDTGRTLLASQLSLPGQDDEAEETPNDDGPSSVVNSLFQGSNEGAASPFGVQPVQYAPVQYSQSGAPVMIQEGGAPMMQPQGGMLMQPSGMMMQPQGAAAYDPMMAPMGGAPMGVYPQGAAPIYLDGMGTCGPQGCPAPCPPCPQPQMYMQPVCPPPAPVCPPPPPAAKWAIWGEAMWIHPTGIDMAHAQQQNGLGGAGTVPFGTIGVVDPAYDLGFRVGGEVRYAPKEAIYLQYSWFESDASSSLAAPNIPGGGGAIGSLVHHPGTFVTASAGPVDATYDIKFQVAEAAWRYWVACSATGELTVFAGGRWGKLDQGFTQSGIFGGGLGGDVDTFSTINFDGGGPLVGVTGEHLIGTSRFTVYGRAMAAALAGTFDSHYRMFNDTTQALLAQSNWSDDRIVPMIDYELGVAWVGPQGRLRLALGYMTTFWFNTVTTPVWVDAVQANNYVNVSDTIAFDGAVGRIECRW